jgi:hypothetical protein
MPFKVSADAKWQRRVALAVALAIGCASATLSEAQAGPTSALYLTDSSVGGAVYVVQGGAVINSWTGTPNPNAPLDSNPAIAVGETVRTYPQGFVAGAIGAEYSLTGVSTGATYLNTVGCCFRDGTTDGVYNYAIRDIVGDNVIYRFSRDWADPELVVIPGPGLGEVTGITFDPRNNSFWISGESGIFNITLDGDLLGAILPDTISIPAGALAFDPADNTLWVASNFGSTLQQFSSAGGFERRDPIDSFVLTSVGSFRGAEFALAVAVPEPASWALMIGGLGLLGVMRRRQGIDGSGSA